MAGDGEQQAMTRERLAEIEHQQHQMAHDGHAKLSNELFLTVAVSDLLAEVERRRAREAALLAVARAVADTGADFDMNTGNSWLLFPGLYAAEQCREQARALLASAGSEGSGGDGA